MILYNFQIFSLETSIERLFKTNTWINRMLYGISKHEILLESMSFFSFLLLFYPSVLLHIRGPLSRIRGVTALLRRRWRKFRHIDIKYLLRMSFYIFHPEFNSRLWREPCVNVHHVITRAIVRNNYIYYQWSSLIVLMFY